MNTSEIKSLVTKFRREFGIRDVSAESLEDAFRKQGFTIIDFNPAVNDPDVTTVIEALGLKDMINHSSGFVYVDGNYRLVFLNEKLNAEERLVVLSHEEGHYYCGHTCSRNEVGRTVIEEREANEFSHYLLQGTVRSHVSNATSKYKKPLIIGAVIAGLAVGGGVASKEIHDRQLYEGEYYVTMHGEKYHRENRNWPERRKKNYTVNWMKKEKRLKLLLVLAGRARTAHLTFNWIQVVPVYIGQKRSIFLLIRFMNMGKNNSACYEFGDCRTWRWTADGRG